MYSGKLVFAQRMEHLPLHSFRRCVQHYPSIYPIKIISYLNQFLCMAFAQLTYRECLRYIELACADYRSVLLLPLADRTVLQMDQIAFSDQAALWHYRKCSVLLYTILQILSLIPFDKTPLD